MRGGETAERQREEKKMREETMSAAGTAAEIAGKERETLGRRDRDTGK